MVVEHQYKLDIVERQRHSNNYSFELITRNPDRLIGCILRGTANLLNVPINKKNFDF